MNHHMSKPVVKMDPLMRRNDEALHAEAESVYNQINGLPPLDSFLGKKIFNTLLQQVKRRETSRLKAAWCLSTRGCPGAHASVHKNDNQTPVYIIFRIE
jgi:hypothetical protein